MLIQIHDADKAGKRKMMVTDNDREVFSHTVADTDEAHKLAKIGQKHGWDSDEMAAATKPTKAKK